MTRVAVALFIATLAGSTSRPFAPVDAEKRMIIVGELSSADAAKRARLPFAVLISEPIDSTCSLTIAQIAEGQVGSATWNVEIPGTDLTVRRELHLPPGHYKLTMDCGAEYSAQPAIVNAEKENVDAIQMKVAALPRISGRITAPAEAAGVALLHDEEGHLLGRPEADGSFRILIAPEAWPRNVVVSAAGYGPVVMALPESPTVVELPDIELKKAGRLILSGPPAQLQAIETVQIFTLRGKRQRTSYRTLSSDALRRSSFLVDVAPGKYFVELRGTQPLERFGITTTVAAGEEIQLPIALGDQEVDVRTFLGEQKLGDAELVVESVDALWNTSFRTSSDGDARLRVWQPGEVVFILQSASIGHSGTVELRGPHIDIRVPNRTVEGKLVDAETEQPLADVNVALRNGRGAGTMTKSGPDGTFRFVGIEPGTYRVMAGGANGLSTETVSIEVHEDAGVRRVRLALRRQKEFDLEILTWNGSPAAAAAVVELSGPVVLSLRNADQTGAVRLPVASSIARSIVVIAADGGLYAQPLVLDGKQSKLRITIPPSNSSITVSVASNAGRRPIAGISLVMRLNGVFFPSEVMELLHARAGIVLTSDESGQIRLSRVPTGLYEFWPIRSRSDLQAILAGQPPAAPVVIAAGPGENRATLGFAATRGMSP